jgi:hypothetical protein
MLHPLKQKRRSRSGTFLRIWHRLSRSRTTAFLNEDETATDDEVIDAFFPALESANGWAYAMKIAKDMLQGDRAVGEYDHVCDLYGHNF